jgi:hypothetical protein
MMRAFVEGDEVGKGESGSVVRFIGYSRSRSCGVGLDVGDGDLYVAESLQPLGERLPRVPEMPADAPGTAAWAVWARDCFALASSLGEADWVLSSDWSASQEDDAAGDGGGTSTPSDQGDGGDASESSPWR